MELPKDNAGPKTGTFRTNLFLFLFSLPFLGTGLGVGYLFYSKLTGPEGYTSNLLPLLVFSLIFTGAGLFLMLVAPRLTGTGAPAQDSVSSVDSDDEGDEESLQPWLQNAEWAKGKIECSNQGAMWGVWIFAIIWCAVSIPAGYEPLMDVLERGQYGSIIFAIFPLIGALLLILAVWMTIRWRKFGCSVFELSNQTGYIGGELKGTIRTAVQITTQGDYTLKIKCLEKITTGSGKNRSTTTQTRWEDSKKIPGGGINSRMGIPVQFSIPSSCLETDDDTATGTILWALQVAAPVKGVDYSADFSVPVYRRERK